MKNKTSYKVGCYYLIFILICIISCQNNIQEGKDCLKFKNENYVEEVTDISQVREAYEFQKILLERFGESAVKDLSHEAYHLQFYSSHGYGKSVKFEKKIDGCSIAVKCKTKDGGFPNNN